MKRFNLLIWMLVCFLMFGSSSVVRAAETGTFTEEESYLTRSFLDMNQAGELEFEGTDASAPAIVENTKQNGILVTANTSVLNNGKFTINKKFNFAGNRVGRLALDALAEKGTDLKIEFYLDNQTESFATFSVEKQGSTNNWTRDICIQQDVLEENIRGDHTISFSVISDDDASSVSILLRSIEFVESDLPTVYMELDESLNYVADMNNSSDKSIECYGKMKIEIPSGYTFEFGDNAGQTTSEDSVTTYDLSFLRGRGNSTWTQDKKPYKIKLDKKGDLLGMGSSKNWALIANRYDNSKLRNRMTYWLGNQLGMEFTPESVPVDVVMNGIYFGSYYLSQTVRLEKNSVNIDDLEKNDETKASTDPSVISGGYLLGYNLWGVDEDATTFKTNHGLDLALLSPELKEYTNDAQYNYIKDYVQKTEDAIYGEDFKDEDGVSYTEYMDLDSAVDYFLIQETSMNGDGFNTSSTYLYKKRDGKLYWGPLWDFDYVAWNGSYAFENYQSFAKIYTKWFTRLLGDPVFCKRLYERWAEIKDKLLSFCADGGQMDQYVSEMEISLRYDEEKWGIYDFFKENGWTDETCPDSAVGVHDVSAEIERLRTWVQNRVAWLDANLGILEAKNIELTFMVDGETYTTKNAVTNNLVGSLPDAPSKKGYEFAGWGICDENGNLTGEYANANSAFASSTTLSAVYMTSGTAVLPKSLYLSDSYINLNNQYSCTLHSSVYPAGAAGTITYSSSDEDIATVDQNGQIIPHTYYGGDTTITVMCGNLKRTCHVHVYNKSSEYFDTPMIMTDSSTLTLKKGQYKQIELDIEPEDYDYASYIWYSFDSSVADVDQCGVITAKKAGKAKIILMSEEGEYTIAYTCTVTVTDPSKSSTIKKGYIYTYKGLKYKVTSKTSKGGTVTILGPTGKKIKSVNIRSTLKIKGETFKVTGIASKAFYNCKNLRKVYMGKNIKTIGKKAFTGINKHARFRVPTSKKKAYKKLLTKSRGFRKNTMKIYLH